MAQAFPNLATQLDPLSVLAMQQRTADEERMAFLQSSLEGLSTPTFQVPQYKPNLLTSILGGFGDALTGRPQFIPFLQQQIAQNQQMQFQAAAANQQQQGYTELRRQNLQEAIAKAKSDLPARARENLMSRLGYQRMINQDRFNQQMREQDMQFKMDAQATAEEYNARMLDLREKEINLRASKAGGSTGDPDLDRRITAATKMWLDSVSPNGQFNQQVLDLMDARQAGDTKKVEDLEALLRTQARNAFYPWARTDEEEKIMDQQIERSLRSLSVGMEGSYLQAQSEASMPTQGAPTLFEQEQIRANEVPARYQSTVDLVDRLDEFLRSPETRPYTEAQISELKTADPAAFDVAVGQGVIGRRQAKRFRRMTEIFDAGGPQTRAEISELRQALKDLGPSVIVQFGGQEMLEMAMEAGRFQKESEARGRKFRITP